MVSGLPNKTIAEKLFVSPGTIKTHTLNIYQKLDVGNRTSAIMKAIELNWFV
jgi:DNA-binding NarL/FixJ family response regulator